MKISEAIKTLYKFEPPSLADVVDDTGLTSQPELEKIEEIQMRQLVASRFLFGEWWQRTAQMANHLTQFGHPAGNTSASDSYYEELLRIYRSIESTLPHWNNPKYAYSGLHSIIHPPPPELNLWGSVVIPIFQNKPVERPPTPQCSFCFENYAEVKCQFYEPKKTEFQKVSDRNGRAIVCECCDHSGEEEEGDQEDQRNLELNGNRGNGERVEEERIGDPFYKRNGADSEQQQQRRRKSNELNEISNNLHRNGDEETPDKLAKIQESADQKENGTAKVQAGWYGKGYRKYRQRRRKS